ncbi:XF1762 family protein [Myxococcus sp. AM010]|uniref:XF1762 family protein n=1 Tax=Myxococcus sp. AM010 TaxID=2745138 RepID=UPI0015962855|nr:XF1762 family protein [Myxococcus sp. AM010]NVJ13155.1 hypothetical protein [Myxococcus sp. AM010]
MSRRYSSLRLVPVTLEQAQSFVDEHHRHHDPAVGHRWSHGLWDEARQRLCGVAMVGRPVARGLCKRRIVEVNRLATDGTPNGCSMLYAAAARAAESKGYFAIVTYTLDSESGASLRAAGWWGDREAVEDRDWNCRARPRDTPRLGTKTRWVRFLREYPEGLPPPEDAEEQVPPLLALMGGGR